MKKTKSSNVGRGNYQVGRTHPTQPKAELKAFDVTETTTTFTQPAGPPTAVVLNAIPQGADFNNRIGRKVYNKSLQLRGWVQNANTQGSEDFCRLVVLYDAQPNAALPTFATTFKDANAAAASTVLSGLNIDERERFKILLSEEFLIPPVTNAAGVETDVGITDGSQHLKFNRFIDLKGIETCYNVTNGGTIADITSGSIIIFFFGQTGEDQANWSTRIRYYD